MRMSTLVIKNFKNLKYYLVVNANLNGISFINKV